MSRRPSIRVVTFLTPIIVLSLVSLWVLSSLSYAHGGYLFAGGLLALGGVLLLFWRGYRKPLFSFSLVLLLLSLTIGCMEMVLWATPQVLRGKAALYTYHGYHCDPGGIYQLDSHLGRALRPDYSRWIYWNGHWWHHEANAAGYRGKEVSRADAVFLGDSLIHGHGVSNEQTVPSRFAAHTDLTVANLGQQGTCLVQMYLRYHRLGQHLQPRYVFVCSHHNDVTDATYWYSREELERFLASPVGEHHEPLVLPAYQPVSGGTLTRFWNEQMTLPLRSARALHFLLVKELRKSTSSPVKRPPQDQQNRYVPPQEEVTGTFAPWSLGAPKDYQLGWRVHVHALAKIKHLCDQQGAQLVILDLGYPVMFSRALEELADQLGVTYVAAGRRALSQALAGEEIYLVDDGHWSGLGCEVVAGELASSLGLSGR